MGRNDPLPAGDVAFCFTDMEASTPLLATLGPDRFGRVVDRMREGIAACVDRHDGRLVSTEGDGMFLVFADATNALAALVDAQVALAAEDWVAGVDVRVRMGVHVGSAVVTPDRNYVGLAVNQASRVSAAAHGGQIVASASAVDAVAGRLPELADVLELGRFHVRDFAEPVALFQVVHPDLRADFAPPRVPAAVVHNLRRAATPLLGRDDDVVAIAKAVLSEPLVTLIGVGGVGKSRLAAAAAEACTREFDGGAFVVELAGVSDADRVDAAVAAALDVKAGPQQSLTDSIQARLEQAKTLLLLDNCEHLLEAVAPLVDRLVTRTESTVLATSREPLDVRGEQLWRVEPLPVPTEDADAGELAANPALRLFMQRAKRADRSLDESDPDVRSAAARVCRLVDGLPLAIELAAGLAGRRTPTELADSLVDALPELVGGYRTDDARQRGLAATLDWSAALLNDAQLEVLERLAVFRGGWTPEAAVAICSHPDAPQIVAELVERSLVEVDAGGRPRLLEPVRQWAAARLSPDEARRLALAHGDWFGRALSRDRDKLERSETETVDGWRREIDNIGAAIAWGLATGDPVGAKVANEASTLMRVLGEVRQSIEWLDAVAAMDLPEDLQILIGSARGSTLLRIGNLDAARAVLAEQIARTEAVGNAAEQAVARGLYALVAANLNLPDAGDLMAKAPDELAAVGYHQQSRSARLNYATFLSMNGHFDEAEAEYEKVAALADEAGDHMLKVVTLLNRAATATNRKRPRDELLMRHRAALEAAQAAGQSDNEAVAALNLGIVQRDFFGEVDEMIAPLEIAYRAGKRGRHDVLARAAWALGFAAWDRGDPDRAARYFDEAEVSARINRNSEIVLHALAARAALSDDEDAAVALAKEALAATDPAEWSNVDQGVVPLLLALVIGRRDVATARAVFDAVGYALPLWAGGLQRRVAALVGASVDADVALTLATEEETEQKRLVVNWFAAV